MKPSGDKGSATPVMRQYRAAKEAHPDAMLFFRMGDFYELFYDDAVVASRVLELSLTSRNKGAAEEIPMAGVPHHSASGYIQKLLDQGFKVALCEQMTDPATVKGIVPREVVRVVSPGIAFDDAGLVATQNHYLLAVDGDSAGRYGIASLDLSVGELSACEADDAAVALAEVVRLDPREVLLGPGALSLAVSLKVARPNLVVRLEEAAHFDERECARVLGQVLGEDGASHAPTLATQAAARCIAMATACEPGRALPIARLAVYSLGDTLILDESTQTHLELVRTTRGDAVGALLSQIDATKTAPGARLLRKRLLAPMTNVAQIRRRLDAVELFVTQSGLRSEIQIMLTKISDLERLAVKLAVDRATPRDLGSLGRSLAMLPQIVSALDGCREPAAREALGIAPGEPWIDPCADLCELLARAMVDDPPLRAGDGPTIREGFDADLDASRTLAKDGQRLLVELEARLREEAQISSLKVRFTRVFGWYLEVTRTHLEKVPSGWRRKQTVAGGERFTCDALDDLADRISHADSRTAAREAELLTALIRDLAQHERRLRVVAGVLAEWDVSTGLAEVAHRYDYVRPDVDASTQLVLEEARHPVVERLAAAEGRFVPNDVALEAKTTPPSDANRLWLITGPNMAGKSTLMRQVALIVILAQMGSYVPATRAHIGVVDRVLTRVGASDNLAKGESTFMVEMKETANVLRRATVRSLVVLDEIGRGTSTYDGLAIAWAVAEYLHDVVGCRALFATHYHELTELSSTHSGCENWSVSAREHQGDIVFLHKLQRGAASQSYGVACARLAGLPEMVLARARVLLLELEQGDVRAPHTPKGNFRSLPKPQLDLFHAVPPMNPAYQAMVATIRSVDVDRLTPLEALQLVAALKRSVET